MLSGEIIGLGRLWDLKEGSDCFGEINGFTVWSMMEDFVSYLV